MATNPTPQSPKSKFSKIIFAINDGGLWPLIIPAAGIIFLLISTFFHLNNDYSKACALSPWYMKGIGLGTWTLCGISLGKSQNEDWHIPGVVWCLIAFVFLVLGVFFFANFFNAAAI